MLFGPKISTVFKSRWNALMWATGILMTAYCTVPHGDDEAGGQNPMAAATPTDHANPWARVSDTPSGQTP